MFLSVDRFEKQYAICESDDQKLHKIKKAYLPKNTKPGDILKILKNGKLILDEFETKTRKNKIKKLQNKLLKID